MNILIDRNNTIPISHQLYQQFSDRILSGFINEGEKLPSIRSLSKSLTVSPLTIIKVYEQLELNGLIERHHGKGTYVKRKNKIEQFNENEKEDPFQWQMSIPDYLSRSQFRYNPNLSYVYDGFNLSVASINHKLLPTSRIIKDSYNFLQNNIKDLSKYPPVQGDLELRELIAKYLQRKNIKTSEKSILITNGAQQGISLIVNTFVGPGDIVIMETPTYPGAIDLFKCKGAKILTIPMDSEGMRTDILMSLCDKYSPKIIYTIPHFHNPTGYTMSNKRKIELLDIAKQHNCIIIEDDPWSEISYTDIKAKSLKSMDSSGHVVYIKSISKIIGPAYRLAVVAAEGSILSKLIASKANHDLGTAILPQKMLLNFLKVENISNYLEQLNMNLLKRRDKVISILKKHSPKGTLWTVPEGGINIWITLPKHFHVEKLLYSSITTKNVSFLPGTICYPNDVEFNNLRICFSYLDEEHLEKAVIELCIIMNNMAEHNSNNNDHIPIV